MPPRHHLAASLSLSRATPVEKADFAGNPAKTGQNAPDDAPENPDFGQGEGHSEPQNPPKTAPERLVARSTTEFTDWAAALAAYCGCSIAQVVERGLIAIAERTGFINTSPPPERIGRRIDVPLSRHVRRARREARRRAERKVG